MANSVWEWARRLCEAEQPLRPEFERIVQSHAVELHGLGNDMGSIKDVLRHFARALEEAEGEDPRELDPGSPRKKAAAGSAQG